MNDSDLRRIAFSTQAYPRMRDSIRGLLLGPGLLLMLRGMRQEDEYLVFGACLQLGGILALRCVDRRLDRRFGRVLKTSFSEADQGLISVMVVLAVTLVFALDDWALEKGGPPAFMLSLAAGGLWVSVRGWPFRLYTLIFPAVCAAAAAQLAGSGPGPSLELRLKTDMAAVLAWMSIGFLDLIAMRRVFRQRLDSAHTESHHADAV